MKKNIIAAIAAALVLPSYSQNLGISAGVKFPKITQGNIFFVYQDESPVPDIIASEVPLTGSNLSINLAVDYQGNQKLNEPYIFLRGQGYFGQIVGGDLGLGIGYVLPVGKKIQLLPEVSALLGICTKDLGTLDVQAAGSVYITVNNTQYDNYQPVNISLQNIYYGIRPGISASFNVGKKTYLRLHGAYLISLGNSRVAFRGPSNSEDALEYEKLKDRNLYFDINGSQTQKAPFKANGPEIRLGLYFPL